MADSTLKNRRLIGQNGRPSLSAKNMLNEKLSRENTVSFSRRDFVKTSVLGAVAAGVGANAAVPEAVAEPAQQGHSQNEALKRPIIICAHNGHAYLEAAYAFLKGGGDTLDAAIRVVKGPEDDPNDDSV